MNFYFLIILFNYVRSKEYKFHGSYQVKLANWQHFREIEICPKT